jgi:hypothetical protein
MVYKMVGVDAAGHFPPRVEAALNATYGPAAQAAYLGLKAAFVDAQPRE